ncbi:MAG: AI-2E family transporter [Methanomicrobiales archaeon HGW-Methanomicrobiales-3]|nr:MAG: AI-2E family transporter [Methanomicrobiales archaeon HGW-Methanomicrobiales-3]
MNVFRSDQFPFILMVILAVSCIVVFWSIMDMVLLGASLAIVLIPLHRRLVARTRPVVSAALITLIALALCGVLAYGTYSIFTSNAGALTTMFTTIGNWIGNPATNPLAYGIPLSKANLTGMLAQADAIFVNFTDTVIEYLNIIIFKLFTFFFTLFILLLHGDELRGRIMEHLPPSMTEYVTRLSDVTVDTLYAIYVVQIAIAVLTFFIALPVFYLLGYGNILFYSFFAAFCELIPVLGSSATFIVIGAYAFALGDMRGVLILFFLGYFVVALLPEIWIRPVLVGRRVKIHPVIMFIGIIGGILTMGLAGFVLGPVIIVLFINTYRMYIRDRKDGTLPKVFFRDNS